MKTIATLAFAASLAAAQVTYNQTTGTFTCAPSHPDGAYCAGDSMGTNIIIRCNNGVGQPGNCNDNLAGEPPLGVGGALCYQSSPTAGDAACEKNCIVYAQPTFSLPSCTPSYTASSSSASATATSTGSAAGTTVTGVVTATTTICPVSSPSSSWTTSWATGQGSATYTPPANGTASATGTKTPVGPTKSTSATTSPSSVVTAGAAVQKAGGALAVAGLVAAYFI